MPIGDWIDVLRAGVGLVPPTILAIILLGGPTALWLLYRFVIEPRTHRMRVFELAPYWVCANCRSVNNHRLARCYHCDAPPVDDDLEVIETNPYGPGELTPVGPGLNFGAPAAATRPAATPSIVARSAALDNIPRYDMPAVEWDGESEDDRAALPDVAAMTEVIEGPYRRRSAQKPAPTAVGPGRPAAARPRRVAVVGQPRDTDDDPAAA